MAVTVSGAAKLGVTDVITHVGFLPENPRDPDFADTGGALRNLARAMDAKGQYFLFETGQETPVTLRRVIEDVGTGNLGINLDPANLVMVTKDDPVAAVYTLKDYIVHTHAKDGVNLHPANPEYIYRVVHPVPAELAGIRFFQEVPLGEGSVPFDKYLAALDDKPIIL